jgi:non-specific serine/threonine protein kinase
MYAAVGFGAYMSLPRAKFILRTNKGKGGMRGRHVTNSSRRFFTPRAIRSGYFRRTSPAYSFIFLIRFRLGRQKWHQSRFKWIHTFLSRQQRRRGVLTSHTMAAVATLAPERLVLETQWTLLPHQRECIAWLQVREKAPCRGVRGGIISIEMGLGKTLIALYLCMCQPRTGPSLYICNKTLLYQSQDECRKFFGRTARTLVIHSDHVGSLPDYVFPPESLQDMSVVFITYDTILCIGRYLRDPSVHPKPSITALLHYPWFRIIADESHRMSQPRTTLFRLLSSFPPGRRVCLTGTPMKNGYTALFTQLAFCGLVLPAAARRTSDTYSQYALHQFSKSMTQDEAGITLPAIHETKHVLTLSDEERALYTTEERLYRTMSTDSSTKPYMLTAHTRFLRQLCSTNRLCNTAAHPSTKFQCIYKLVRATPTTDKIIMFSFYPSVLAHLSDYLAHMGVGVSHLTGSDTNKKRAGTLERFKNAPSEQVLLLPHSIVGATGLNVAFANHVFLLEVDWDSSLRAQAVTRAYRLGQTKCCFVHEFEVQGTIEEYIFEATSLKHRLPGSVADTELQSEEPLRVDEPPPPAFFPVSTAGAWQKRRTGLK